MRQLNGVFWFLLLLFNALLWYLVGVRVEQGRREQQRNSWEEERHQRSLRGSTTKMNQVKIRR